jgi:transposase
MVGEIPAGQGSKGSIVPPVKGFRGLKREQKAEIVERVLELYCNGTLLKNIAPHYGVHEKTLYRLILKINPKGWWAAQHVKEWCNAEEVIEAGVFSENAPRALKKKLKRADWRLDRIDARRHRFFET